MTITRTHADGLELRVDGQESRFIHPLVRHFIWRESMIEGGFSWVAHLTTNAWQEWNDLLLGRGRNEFQLRLTTEDEGEQISTEWRTAITDSSKASFRGETMIAEIRGGDARLNLQQVHAMRTFPNATVDEVASLLAQEAGLTASVEPTADRSDRVQTQESNWDFLRRLTYETASQGGRGDLFLWVDEKTLNLRAPQLQLPADRRHNMDEVENRVDNVVLSYAGRQVDRRGGATLRGVGFDWGRKEGVQFNMNSAAAQTHPSLAGRVPRAMADGVRYLPVMERTQAEVEAQTRGRWGRYAPRYFSLRVDSRPDLTLRPGMILELNATLGEDQETPFLGRFLVAEIQHEMVRASILTTAVCYRREAAAGDEAATGSSAANAQSRDPFRVGQPAEQRVVLRAEVIL